MLNRRQFLLGTAAASQVRLSAATRIRQIDIYHHSHLDVGYTELPSVCRDMHRRYLDAALDQCLADPRFRWTAEAQVPLDDWWRAAGPNRRSALLKCVEAGQIDVMALPFNQTPFLNARQWEQMFAWIPADLWKAVQPRAAMQSDVNGLPRAGAMRLLDRGVRHLIMGINTDFGGTPLPRPSAFWWKMQDGRKLFVWQGFHYGAAYNFFHEKPWGRGGHWLSTELRLPRSGDFFRTDEASLRQAHKVLLEQLGKMENRDYSFDRLLISMTNQWRWDNDPPFPPLPDFVEAWNRLGLEPKVRLVTGTRALLDLEEAVGSQVPELSGEWTDWWANGDASGPREVAASRVAKRALAAAESPVWGPLPASAAPQLDAILRDLCLFDEHTWGADESISRPDSFNTLSQYNEKSALAYRPMGHAEWLLARRARTRLAQLAPGVHVVNTAAAPYSGWVRIHPQSLSDNLLIDERGGRHAIADGRVWLEGLAPRAITRFGSEKGAAPAPKDGRPNVEVDANGWPVSASWEGMSQPLFAGELAHFLRAAATNREQAHKVHETSDAALRKQILSFSQATYGQAKATETPFTLIYEQPIHHERLGKAERVVELWRGQPRARITVRFDRLTSQDPEVLYLAFALPPGVGLPVFATGGMPYLPYRDQIPGTCRDYFAIDGWAHYRGTAGNWLWVTRDAPLVAVGGPHTIEKSRNEPADPHRLLAMVFDNFWHTNFVADSHGQMEFQFELAWSKELAAPDALAETLVSEPVVLINDGTKEAPSILEDLYKP